MKNTIMSRRKISVVAVLLILVSVISLYTGAYFTAKIDAHNVITMGGIKIQLNELTDKTDAQGNPVPFEDIHDAMPGVTVSKQPIVTNIGNHDAWIRMAVTGHVVFADGTEDFLDPDMILLDTDMTQWLSNGDGYYYYPKPLLASSATEPLFQNVKLSDTMGNQYQNAVIEIQVTADAVQCEGNGTTVLDALGWPMDKEGTV